MAQRATVIKVGTFGNRIIFHMGNRCAIEAIIIRTMSRSEGFDKPAKLKGSTTQRIKQIMTIVPVTDLSLFMIVRFAE